MKNSADKKGKIRSTRLWLLKQQKRLSFFFNYMYMYFLVTNCFYVEKNHGCKEKL